MKTWFVVIAALAGCQKVDNASSPPPAAKQPATPKAKAPGGNATVALTLTGAIEKTISGPKGFCAIPMIGGVESGATFQVQDGDVQLSIVATSAAELAAPRIVINTNGTSYLPRRAVTTAKLVPGSSARSGVV